MIVALTTAIALIATAALLGLLLQMRRFAARLADRVDHAERLAEGRAASEASDGIASIARDVKELGGQVAVITQANLENVRVVLSLGSSSDAGVVDQR